jgi:F-type H+-transporting ATPase subunit b
VRRPFFAALWRTVLLSLGACVAFAQETAQAQEPADTLGPWKIANTLIFAVGLGYFIYRYAPGFFNTRSADIQKAIREATGLKMEADLRYSEIDRKMATLGDEVGKLRERSAIEIEREHQRIQAQTRAELVRIQHNLGAEIDAFRQRGVRTLRQQAAQSAMELATRRLEERIEEAEPEQSVQDLIHLVERGRA